MKTFTFATLFICLSSVFNSSFAQTNSAAGITQPTIEINPIGLAKGEIRIKWMNQPEGNYTVQLQDNNGNIIGNQEVKHTSSIENSAIHFPKITKEGMYQIIITRPNNSSIKEKVLLFI